MLGHSCLMAIWRQRAGGALWRRILCRIVLQGFRDGYAQEAKKEAQQSAQETTAAAAAVQEVAAAQRAAAAVAAAATTEQGHTMGPAGAGHQRWATGQGMAADCSQQPRDNATELQAGLAGQAAPADQASSQASGMPGTAGTAALHSDAAERSARQPWRRDVVSPGEGV